MANNNNQQRDIIDTIADVVTTQVASEAISNAIYEAWGPPQPASNQQTAINQGDTAAGRVNNTAVVSDADVGNLQAAISSIDGSTAEGQFALARVGAALDSAKAKLAAAKAT